MIGLIILIAISVISFAAGYGVREVISRRRRAIYLTYRAYLPQPSHEVPTFLLRAAQERRLNRTMR